MSLIGYGGARSGTRGRCVVVAVAVLTMLLLVEPFVAPAAAGGKGSSRSDRSANADSHGKSDKGKSEKGKSEKGKSDKGKSDKGKSDKGKSDKGKSDKGKSDKGKPGKGKSEKGKSEKGKSEKGKSGKGKSERGKTEKRSDKDKGSDQDKAPDKLKSQEQPRDERAQGHAAGPGDPVPPAPPEVPSTPAAVAGPPAVHVPSRDDGGTEVADRDVRRSEAFAVQPSAAPSRAPAPSAPAGGAMMLASAADAGADQDVLQLAARAALGSPPLSLMVRPPSHVPARVIESSREVAVEVGRDLTEHPEFPLVLMLAAGLFLLLQHRMDRNEPKLTVAPAHQSVLEFQPLPEDPHR